jgi:hypothetical protein
VQNAHGLSINARCIAHLSDLHILAERSGLTPSVLDLGMRFASFGRALAPKQRIRKLVDTLRAARDADAGHLILSGDLGAPWPPGPYVTERWQLLDKRATAS